MPKGELGKLGELEKLGKLRKGSRGTKGSARIKGGVAESFVKLYKSYNTICIIDSLFLILSKICIPWK